MDNKPYLGICAYLFCLFGSRSQRKAVELEPKQKNLKKERGVRAQCLVTMHMKGFMGKHRMASHRRDADAGAITGYSQTDSQAPGTRHRHRHRRNMFKDT